VEEVTFAVIGSGFMGDLLARVGSELPYARCVAAADVKLENAQRLVASYGGSAYKDYAEMLEHQQPDTIFVATPEFDHREPVIAS
jgi:predicted dehydrogenase